MSEPSNAHENNKGFEPSCTDAEGCREILRRVAGGERIQVEEALSLALYADADELFACSDAVRQNKHPDGIVTYVVDRNINYSNVCTSVCSFCAFYRKPGDSEGYVLSLDDIHQKVDETIQLGGSGTLMQGGLHPDLPMSWYTDMLRSIKDRHPEFYLHCFSPTEVHAFTSVTGLSTAEVL